MKLESEADVDASLRRLRKTRRSSQSRGPGEGGARSQPFIDILRVGGKVIGL